MISLIERFVSDDEGATAIEYGLIAALIALAIIASLTNVKTGLVTTFNRVSAGFASR